MDKDKYNCNIKLDLNISPACGNLIPPRKSYYVDNRTRKAYDMAGNYVGKLEKNKIILNKSE